jgi:hypothetical protein
MLYCCCCCCFLITTFSIFYCFLIYCTILTSSSHYHHLIYGLNFSTYFIIITTSNITNFPLTGISSLCIIIIILISCFFIYLLINLLINFSEINFPIFQFFNFTWNSLCISSSFLFFSLIIH